MNDVIRKVAADTHSPLLDMHPVFETVGNIGLDAGRNYPSYLQKLVTA
ncbi:hypothetical protein [Larkinella terrae]|uniref:Uncharacterized protein n=1 Tax=Larkinella terrae TaxID=2025311 RepID=A0A7K0EX19_9BACT|nr:hypothetical protein [Larkinella terrae]MRS65798.1 hypothetical protein [Larkinella terrae]